MSNQKKIDTFFKPKPNPNSTLTEGQQQFMKYAKLGHNILLTGQAGTGKSFCLDNYYKWACRNYGANKIHKTATTGIAALNIQGRTIYSWAGIGLGSEEAPVLLKNMFFKTKSKWKAAEVIILDEVSMLSPELLDKLDWLGQHIRGNDEPFGGIQIILVGDFFQLPVVKNPRFAFDAVCWNKLVEDVVELTENVRQEDDPVFQKILREIRVGECSSESIRELEKCVGKELNLPNGMQPTRLFPKNRSADALNNSKLKALPGKYHKFEAEYKLRHNHSTFKKKTLLDYLRKNVPVGDKLSLKVNTQVVFKKNVPEWEVVNGTCGIVTSFDEVTGNPVVKTISGTEILVLPVEFAHELKDDPDAVNKKGYRAVKIQIPLKLSWATTIHQSQGTTLEAAIIDCGENVFDFGQSYVALSRVKSLAGLSLLSFDPDSIEANQRVIDFYKNPKETPKMKTKLKSKNLYLSKQCPICLNEYDLDKDEIKALECGHVFHKKCYEPISDQKKCPMCRKIDTN
jgi:ATP-dependent exoDNAse (exonuclease V) alpha subunit